MEDSELKESMEHVTYEVGNSNAMFFDKTQDQGWMDGIRRRTKIPG